MTRADDIAAAMPDDRDFALHCARVYLVEAARRRNDPVSRRFYWTLLAWASDQRRKVAALPKQRELFGSAA
jgi:hypothetical protein